MGLSTHHVPARGNPSFLGSYQEKEDLPRIVVDDVSVIELTIRTIHARMPKTPYSLAKARKPVSPGNTTEERRTT
jgi:hypothetical protein